MAYSGVMRAGGRTHLVAMALLIAGCSTTTEPTRAAPTSSVPGSLPTASAGTTSTSTTTPTTLATTSTTRPPPRATFPSWPAPEPDYETTGLELAQRLATAFAEGDWDTARDISPLPEWDDETYEEGFAGLEAATLYLGGSRRESPDRFVMYLLQVAHEIRDTGPQTSIYCVRWDLLTQSDTIDRVAGELMLQEDGHTPPSDAQRGAWTCDGFDLEHETVITQPAGEASPDSDLPDGWVILSDLGTEYVCSPVLFRTGDYDCQQYTGTIPTWISFAELRCTQRGASYDCSSDGYYPSELDGYELVTFEAYDYLCRPTYIGSSDLDCVRWRGGSPPVIITPDLRCTQRFGGSVECSADGYYPSELYGFELAEVGWDRVLCQGTQCWIWDTWETPSQATAGFADYVCSLGSCEPA